MDVNKRPIVPDRRKPADPAGGNVEPARPGPLVGAQFVVGAAAAEQLPRDGVAEIAFAGRSNSGKSSAINALAARTRLAFSSRTPGRTQQINFFALREGGLVADLPGYGYAAVSRSIKKSWQEFLWLYVTTRAPLVGLVLLVDARHGIKPLDCELLDAFVPSGRPVLLLATKVDKLNQSEQRAAVTDIRRTLAERYPLQQQGVEVVAFSATRRIGLDAANAALARWLA